MGYTHTGKVLINGEVDQDQVFKDDQELTVIPADDGRQIAEYKKGDFEWWYFDIDDHAAGCFLKIVVHIGTNPLRTKISGQLAVSINSPEKSLSLLYPFDISSLNADTWQCNISVSDKIKIWTEFGEHPCYVIKIDIPEFRCNFRFRSEIEGWKPLGKQVPYQSGNRKADFSWIVPVPRARVDGDFCIADKVYLIYGATGYHDHNFIKVNKKNPLYLDEMVIRWHWGKAIAGVYTLIFMDVTARSNRTLSLMVAENTRIIHSCNNLIESTVLKYGYDEHLKAEYPESMEIRSLDQDFSLRAEFGSGRIIDRRDLLEGVNPIVKFLIKLLIARPAYHGIFASVRLEINGKIFEGTGNFESMVFRGKVVV
jgi:hypothetical protein